MSKEAETGKIYVAGHDRWCRPVVVFDNSVQNTHNWEVCIFADMRAMCDCLRTARAVCKTANR
jgi:hypothetical protein